MDSRGQKVKKSYYAIIPANVRYDKDLTPNAKLLYGEITALCNEKGYCWAGNDYFAELYNVSNRTIIRWINSLEEKEYIKKQVIRKPNSSEVKERRIYINTLSDKNVTGVVTKMSRGHDKNVTTPHDKNVTDNNTVLNNTVNITDEDREEPSVPYEEIKELYNSICKSLSKVRSVSSTRKRHLKARWKQLDFNIDTFQEAFKKVEASDFCTGQNDRGWKADFDWLIKNDNNIIKVLEGKYDNDDGGETTGSDAARYFRQNKDKFLA